MQEDKKKIIVVAGPTAVGKTKYSIDLAKKIGGEIVSLDSMQVYKGFDIGTAKITKDEMEGVPHHMIDVVEPSYNLNIKEFKDMAVKCITDIYGRGKTPILVGGTGFYIRAILYDTEFLEEDENEQLKVREKLYSELAEVGIEKMYEKLKKIDKKSAERIPMGNERRVMRALEFYELHKFPISEHNDAELSKESKYDFTFYVLTMDRDKLCERIGRRVDKMIEDGLLIEIKSLINKGYDKDLNAMKSIGYSELYDYVLSHDEIKDIKDLSSEERQKLNKIIDEIKMHTRNYAKRQMTWFRAQKNIKWITL